MDAGPFFVLGAWAHLQDRCESQKQCKQAPAPACKALASASTWKAVSVSKPVSVCPASKAACMHHPGHHFPSPNPGKGATGCHPSGTKACSSDEDTTSTGGGGGGGLQRPAAMRCGGRGSSPQLSSSPVPGPAELPTVAEVLGTAKTLLAPTHAVERQFYADCYRACQVTLPARQAAASLPPSPVAAAPPPPLPYLSYVPEVALRLSCLGHRVVLRRVTDTKQYWSKSMTNAFCYVVLPGTGIGYVLDPGFKEHFRAGCMSDRYRDIWECLPPLFVGPPAKLVQLVHSLCTELAASFEGAGRQMPPWRTFNATINRWMSPVFRDLPVPPRRPIAAPVATAASAARGGVGSDAAPGAGEPGMIPAAEAQAFLRACEDVLAGTASSPLATAAGDPRVTGSRPLSLAAVSTVSGRGPSGVGSVEVANPGCARLEGRDHSLLQNHSHQQPHQQQQQQHGRRQSQAGGASASGAAAGQLPRQTTTGFGAATEAMAAVGVGDAHSGNAAGGASAERTRPAALAEPHGTGNTGSHLRSGSGVAASPDVGAPPAADTGAGAAAATIAAPAPAQRARPAAGLLSRSLRPQASQLRQQSQQS